MWDVKWTDSKKTFGLERFDLEKSHRISTGDGRSHETV